MPQKGAKHGGKVLMDKETKESLMIGVGAFVAFVVLFVGGTLFVGHMYRMEDESRNDVIATFFVIDEDTYYLVVDSDFLCCSDCLFYFTAYLYNRSTGELVSKRYDGYYDVCDKCLLDENFDRINGIIEWD